jgi:HAD superfamily hydrolase (TIGR01458 family)
VAGLPVKQPKAVLLDLDGTVWDDELRLYSGATTAISWMRERGLAVRFVTNTTRLTRAALAGMLADRGIPASPDDLFTATLAGVVWLGERGFRRVAVLLPEPALGEFAGFELVEARPQALLVGDLGSGWSFEVMNRAFHWLLEGAEFLALHRNPFWKTEGEQVLDAGAFVAALEYASGRKAELVGKPSPVMFEAAARSLGLEPDDLLMVGDSLDADIVGARALGCSSALVRTGRFDPGELAGAPTQPDAVIDSISELPVILR